MNQEEYDARKNYIRSVRASFDHPETSQTESVRQPEDSGSSFAFFKLRILLAVFIFAAYVLCDRTDTSFYGYQTAKLDAMIQKDADLSDCITVLQQYGISGIDSGTEK